MKLEKYVRPVLFFIACLIVLMIGYPVLVHAFHWPVSTKEIVVFEASCSAYVYIGLHAIFYLQYIAPFQRKGY